MVVVNLKDKLTVGTKEVADELRVLPSTVSKWCREGKVEGATQDAEGSPWHIPVETLLKMKKTRGL